MAAQGLGAGAAAFGTAAAAAAADDDDAAADATGTSGFWTNAAGAGAFATGAAAVGFGTTGAALTSSSSTRTSTAASPPSQDSSTAMEIFPPAAPPATSTILLSPSCHSVSLPSPSSATSLYSSVALFFFERGGNVVSGERRARFEILDRSSIFLSSCLPLFLSLRPLYRIETR